MCLPTALLVITRCIIGHWAWWRRGWCLLLILQDNELTTAPRCPRWHHQWHSYPGLRNPGPDNEKIEQKTETCHRFHTDWSHYTISLPVSLGQSPNILTPAAAAGQLPIVTINFLPIKNYSIIDDFLLLIWNWYGVIRSHHLQFITGEEVMAGDERKEDAEVWNLRSGEFNKLLLKSSWRVILQSEKAEKCLYNFCSSISCGFVLSLSELSEGVMLYLHGICNTEGLEAFSICSLLYGRELDLETPYIRGIELGLILRDKVV